MQSPKVLVLIATHDRQSSLKKCLIALSAAMAEIEFVVSLANSGDPVVIPSELESAVRKTKTPRDSFWAESMEVASKFWDSASDFTHVLWLNDDVELFPDSVKNLISLMSSSGADVLVGQTKSKNGLPSYGGFIRSSRLKPLHFDSVFAEDKPEKMETFNGNIVLLGTKALSTIGPFLSGYRHYLADLAYGLEAQRQGLTVWAAPGFSGSCEPNLTPNPALDRMAPRTQRIRVLNTPPGLPIRQQWLFSIRYGGPLGLLYFSRTYTRFLWNLMFRSNRTTVVPENNANEI